MSASRWRLPSGLTVVYESSRAAPVVAMQAWVDVGSADEDAAEAGIAHLHEHMLFKGTARRGAGEIARGIEAAGGEINAWTSFDQTVYHLVLGRDELGLGLDVLADVLSAAAFAPAELEREIEVVCEEIRRNDDQPARRLSRRLFATAYAEHPYGRPVIGWAETVRALSREHILAFYRRHYRPERTTLVVVGDVDVDEVRSAVDACFGTWRSGITLARPARPSEPKQTAPRVEILPEDVKEARLALGWHIPALRHPDIPAIDALAIILGAGEAARLQATVRRQGRLVNDVYAHAYTPRDPGLFLVGAGTTPDKLFDAAAGLSRELLRMAQEPVAASEVERAKTLLLGDSAYQRETVQGLARKLGFYEVVGGDLAAEEAYREAVARLLPADVARAAATVFDAGVTAVVQGPAAWAQGLSVERLTDLCARGFTTEAWRVERRSSAGAALSRHPSAQPSGDGQVRVLSVPHGPTLVLKPEAAPVVAFRAVGLGGLRFESRAESGLANLTASVIGLATATRDATGTADVWARLGGSLAGFVGRNAMGLRAEVLAEHADAGLELFAEALRQPAFAEPDVVRERERVLERLRTRTDSPAAVAFDAFAAALYGAHPYGQRLLGDLESVGGLGVAQVEAHARSRMALSGLVISVVGGFDAAAAARLLSALQGPAPASAPRSPAPPVLAAAVPRVHLPLARAQAQLLVGSLGLRLDDPRREVLDVLTAALSGQGGRLFLDLRDRQSLAYSVSASSVEGLDPGHVLVHLGTAPEKLPAARTGIYTHLERLADEPLAPAELERAQRFLIGSHAIDLQRAGARAAVLALDQRLGLGIEHHRHYAERVRAVSVEAVRQLAAELFAPQRLVEVVVGP